MHARWPPTHKDTARKPKSTRKAAPRQRRHLHSGNPKQRAACNMIATTPTITTKLTRPLVGRVIGASASRLTITAAADTTPLKSRANAACVAPIAITPLAPSNAPTPSQRRTRQRSRASMPTGTLLSNSTTPPSHPTWSSKNQRWCTKESSCHRAGRLPPRSRYNR